MDTRPAFHDNFISRQAVEVPPLLRITLRPIVITILSLFLVMLFSGSTLAAGEEPRKPIYIGLDAEIGHKTSTSDEAIRNGILIAIDDINQAGGLLGGRPLELLIKDNRSVPAGSQHPGFRRQSRPGRGLLRQIQPGGNRSPAGCKAEKIPGEKADLEKYIVDERGGHRNRWAFLISLSGPGGNPGF